MIMPFKIDAGDGGVLSSDFLLKFGGYLIGLLIGVLTTVATEKIGTALAKKNMLIVLVVGFWAIVTLNVFYGFFRLMSTLIVRRYIVNQPLFNVAAESENHKEWYTYLGYILVLALAIVLWVRSFTQKEQYTTSAEHRKQRVVWRNAKRYSILAVVCFVLAILCTTYFVELNTIVITEAPLEEVQTTRMVFADNRFMRFEIETEKDLEDATYVTVNDIRRQEFSVESSGENKYTVSMLVGESSALRYTFKWYGSSGSSEIASAEYIPGTPTWENSDGTVKLTYLETYTAEEECIIIPFETVVDGHLHRFGYKTALNITSRFIVVLKTEGTSNYGVGLDACEVCGEAGYYENNDG
ncbi:MAG: DUF2318 domain-containing protein, partial [Clostridia bacterium]|nr:DUF2318 domain-containing protein [Clostridia bacterium]